MQNQEAMHDGARVLSGRGRHGLSSPQAGSPRRPEECAGCGTVACVGGQSAAHGAQEGMCAAHLLLSCPFGKSSAAFSPQRRRLARQRTTRCPLLWTAIAGLPLIKLPLLRQDWRGRAS